MNTGWIRGALAAALLAGAATLALAADKPIYGAWGLDTAGMDKTVKPGDDFFRYANGTWLDSHAIPADKPAVTLRLEMTDRTEARLHDMLEAAAAVKGPLQLLAVTVLTSNDANDLAALGVAGDPADVVIERARLAQIAGIDGVVCSGADLPRLRDALGRDLLTVCPGIRPAGPAGDDQKRTVDVPTAFAQGADYIVVGRPIRNAPDPRAAADAMVAQIAAATA